MEERRQAILKAVLSNDARERREIRVPEIRLCVRKLIKFAVTAVGRIATVKQEKARQIEDMIIQAAQVRDMEETRL